MFLSFDDIRTVMVVRTLLDLTSGSGKDGLEAERKVMPRSINRHIDLRASCVDDSRRTCTKWPLSQPYSHSAE